MVFGLLTFHWFYVSTTCQKSMKFHSNCYWVQIMEKTYESMNIIREYRVSLLWHSYLDFFSFVSFSVRMWCIFFVKWLPFICEEKVLWNFTKNWSKVYLKESLKSLFKRNFLFDFQLQPLKTKTICNRYSSIQSSRSQCVSKSSRVVKNHNYQWQVIICSCNTYISILKRI